MMEKKSVSSITIHHTVRRSDSRNCLFVGIVGHAGGGERTTAGMIVTFDSPGEVYCYSKCEREACHARCRDWDGAEKLRSNAGGQARCGE